MAIYLKVAGALFALTFLTVIAHHFHVALGSFAGPIAFLIALVKAFLVMAWFMHMKDDKVLNRVIFGTGFFFLAVLFIFCAADIATRVFEQSPL
ncbi:hypothetical protein D3C72_1873220 [compost metagenome]